MNKRKISKLQSELESLRRRKRNIAYKELLSYANKCGRKLRSSKGKEPTYINIYLRYHMPLSIPYHKRNMPVGTAGSILDELEKDLFALEGISED